MHQRGVGCMDILGAGSAESSSALGHTDLIESLLFHEDYLHLVLQLRIHINAEYCWFDGMHMLTSTMAYFRQS